MKSTDSSRVLALLISFGFLGALMTACGGGVRSDGENPIERHQANGKQDSACLMCIYDSECGHGNACVNGCCKLQDSACLMCINDGECGHGSACVNGCCKLQDSACLMCINDGECGHGNACVNGCCK